MTRTPTDERRFAEFDSAFPEVWELFKQFTFECIAEQLSRYSADAVLHRIRWETKSAIDDGSRFKINNNYSAMYSRKFREMYPEYAGFFRTRVARVDREKREAA
jgi:hypothetical protein